MSRTIIALVLLLSVGIASLLFFGRDPNTAAIATNQLVLSAEAPVAPANPPTPPPIVPAPAPATNATPIAAVPTAVPANIIETPDDTEPPLSDAEAAKLLAALEKEYFATQDADERLEVVLKLSDVNHGETVRAVTRLFYTEPNNELKVSLLDALNSIEGFAEEKINLLGACLKPGIDDEVRQTAIDALVDLEDRRAIGLLKALLKDPSEAIRDSAKDAIDIIEDVTK